ncbi:uncharacterized protein LOC128221315 isoform X2 [Mya arenaria]|uniref:uncharacterized protein LOC128221315 isoform X2 n=1 Tax=Mya arenaria TaxID=6604 RepID=UPI0022E314E2|nr:uncharacterized protein LOC128221315 isoform X2 [Mya arenaria]
MKRNGSPKKMQRTEQMCHISKPNNLSNSDVHNGPAHYYEDIAPSSNIGNSDVHNGPAHIMWTLPRVQTLELSTIQGSDKEHLEAKPQLWKLVYRSASGYRNAIPSWIKRLLSSKTNVYIEGL